MPTTMSKQKGASARQVAIDVLHHAREPLRANEIAKRVLASGRCTGLKGKTPEATISAMLAVGSKPGGPFKRVDKGTYTLADAQTAAQTSTKASEPSAPKRGATREEAIADRTHRPAARLGDQARGLLGDDPVEPTGSLPAPLPIEHRNHARLYLSTPGCCSAPATRLGTELRWTQSIYGEKLLRERELFRVTRSSVCSSHRDTTRAGRAAAAVRSGV